jgi:hypothetical protein
LRTHQYSNCTAYITHTAFINASRHSICGLWIWEDWGRQAGAGCVITCFIPFRNAYKSVTLVVGGFILPVSLPNTDMANPFRPQTRPCYPCPICHLVCKTGGGLTRHQQIAHREFTPASGDDSADESTFTTRFHPLLNGMASVNL